jgi:protein gp37
MSENSKIAWTDHTFNPWWGCVKVSAGCKHCYAESFSKRTGKSVWGIDAPRWFPSEKYWQGPVKWNRTAEKAGTRARVFCGSMCDWAETHRNPETQKQMDAARARLARMIVDTPSLDWLLLTKRIESASDYLEKMFSKIAPEHIPDNVWVGTTTENQEEYNKRVPFLVLLDASVRFISVEPQIEKVTMFGNNISLSAGIDWVIVGGESGADCRPFDPDWARSLRDECQDAGISFFMKQLGGIRDHRAELDDLPEDLRVREFPA